MNIFDLKYDKEVKSKHVIFGQCALARNGLTTQSTVVLTLLTDYKELDGIGTAVVTYYYKENIDYINYVHVMNTNSLLLLPTKERSIVEYIQCEKWCDEGTLIEALKTYQFSPAFTGKDKLYEVADFFGLARKELDYWLKEAREDYEV